MNALTFARFYATQAHVTKKGQMYGVLPYTHHLYEVELVLREFGHDEDNAEDLLVAAWLHDIVEDTDVKLRDVEENFGEGVALLVGAVTCVPAPDRKTRNALTYPQIRSAGPRAVCLKLADRIANTRNSIDSGNSMTKKYAKEYPDFKHALFNSNDGLSSMWVELDRLNKVKNND